MYDKLHRYFSTISQYSKTLYASFYSSVLYADVAKHWRGLGMGYLLFLIILGAIPLSGRVNIAFHYFFKEEILFPIQSLPLLSIKNGEIIYNDSMPHLIKNNKGDVISIIDTSGTVSEINQTYPKLRVLVTKNKIDFRFPSFKQFLGLAKDTIDNPIYTRTFDKGLNGLFSGKEWIRSTGISKLNTLMQILVFPCMVLFYFGVFGVFLLLLSSLMQLYSDIFFGLKLSFKTSCRLLAVASTPALALFFLMRYGNFSLSGMGLTYGVLILTYSSYALYSVKRFRV
ncbi:TPA: DUF1189 domain-containing protein [Legionella pneumophila]|nr:DUF1189 domain-containing protein [Legionella pneumophila]